MSSARRPIFLFLLLLIISCKKSESVSATLPPANGLTVPVTLNPQGPGFPLPPNFLGLSYEIGSLTDSTFINEQNISFVNLVKNLGDGYLRVGGNSSDVVVYSGGPRNIHTTSDSLATSDIDRLAAFSNAIGWKVIFGLNLGQFDTSRAAAEALYVSQKLGTQLLTFQNGNEPDGFAGNGLRPTSYSYTNFQQEWEEYFSAVRGQVPSAPYAGPDISYMMYWYNSFADAEHSDVILLDGHYYRTGPATDSSIHISNILSQDIQLPGYCDQLLSKASQYGLGYRISECNSVYDGGKPGVSDVFASSLWALDFMWLVLEHGGMGINFHGGPQNVYTPIAQTNGVFVARPEYYAMLAFKAGCLGATIPAEVNDTAGVNCTVYAAASGATEYVTLINKDENLAASFRINPGKVASKVYILRLTAPSLDATTNTSFAGNQVSANGLFEPSMGQPYRVDTTDFVVNVPAGSAAVLLIQ